MRNHLAILALICLFGLAGSGAWFLLTSADQPVILQHDAAGAAEDGPVDRPETTAATTNVAVAAEDGPVDQPETTASAPGGKPDPTTSEPGPGGVKPQPGATPDPTPGNPGDSRRNLAAPKPKAKAKPKSPGQRARDREEARRIKRGRPAHERLVKSSPLAPKNTGALKKSPEQEEWDEVWSGETFTPPEMVLTQVAGKVMSRQAREGLADATVGLLTFFPVDGVRAGPLLPVLTELKTDENGYFKGEIPAPKEPPINYPTLALTVTVGGYRVMAGLPVATLLAGEPNQLGIFWAPETPFELTCDASQFSGALSVVCTGRLDPQRWHAARRDQVLASFPITKVDPSAEEMEFPPPGYVTLLGTWSADKDEAPYISLLSGGELVQTRRAKVNPKPDELLRPFWTLVFKNESLTPISGQVVDGEGVGVADAVVTTVGISLAQSVVSDSAGWFVLKNPPDMTWALHCLHDDYIEVRQSGVNPGDNNVRIEMKVLKPRIQLTVRDKLTQVPITELAFRITGLYPFGENAGKPMPEESKSMASQSGEYLLEWDVAIQTLIVEKIGYFPRTLSDPTAMQKAAEGRLEIELSQGRKLEVRPREFTAVQQSGRWFEDSKTGPGIHTYWANHWIEYELDFGDAPEQGQEGGYFDLILGCTNRGIVDNEYAFTVDIYVDGKKRGTLTIAADSLNERTGRMALGKLSGTHRVRLIWTNDKWIPDQLDANIRYQSLKLIEQPR